MSAVRPRVADSTPASGNAIEIDSLDVLFGPRAGHKRALAMLDQGEDRDAIREATGIVSGVIDANLEVPAGSIVVLMGLSGSGKSSLLRAVNGLNPSARGAIRIRNSDAQTVDVRSLDRRGLRALRRRSLAMVFQQFALLPWATVAENVAFGLSVRGDSSASQQAAVDRQLDLVGLSEWRDSPISSLSGGMQQRVGLARAFATDAEILLMDEPYSALDPLIREHLQTELLQLQARLGRTILFVSHDLDEALRLGDRIAIMEGGRIVQIGTPDDIVFRPADDYVARFVKHVNPLSVLTASTVMQPVAGEASSVAPGEAVTPDCTVLELLARACETDRAIEVVDGERLVGRVGREDLLRALSRKR